MGLNFDAYDKYAYQICMHNLLSHFNKQKIKIANKHCYEQVAMTDLSPRENNENCLHFDPEGKNYIRLTSGRTKSDMDPKYSTDGAVNGLFHPNCDGACPQYSEINGTTDDDAPLLAVEKDDDDPTHCHSSQEVNSEAMAANKKATKQLSIAAVICLVFMIGEALGGFFAHSLAIQTDAAHLLSDFASFLISLFALWVARRPATTNMSFGYYRAEVLGALVSVLIIWIITGVLFYMAVMRCINQDFEIEADIMMITAGCGILINIILGVVLHYSGHGHSHGGLNHSHSNSNDSNQYEPLSIQSDEQTSIAVSTHQHQHKKNVNVRAAFIHVVGDLIQSIGVFIAAVLIKFMPDWKLADPICTFIFSILVLFTTIAILRDALHVLMEGVPRDINYKLLKEDLLSITSVVTAHGLHVWSLTTTQPALAAHLTVENGADTQLVLQQALQLVRSKYKIHYSTIQVEIHQSEIMANCIRCQGPC